MTKKVILVFVGILAVIGIFYGFFGNKNSKNDEKSTNSDNINSDEKDTNKVTNAENSITSINIANPRLTNIRLPGVIPISQVSATIELGNQPKAGELIILIDNIYLKEITLPILNNKYELNEFVKLQSSTTHELKVKIGNISKSVQVS